MDTVIARQQFARTRSDIAFALFITTPGKVTADTALIPPIPQNTSHSSDSMRSLPIMTPSNYTVVVPPITSFSPDSNAAIVSQEEWLKR